MTDFVTRPDPVDERAVTRRLSAVRLHQALLAVAMLVPAALFGSAAYQNRLDVLHTGRDAIVRTADIMHEHARKVFETQELALGQVDEHLSDWNWDRVAEPATSAYLIQLKRRLDQVISIWVADRNGIIRAGSESWPAGSDIAMRDYFIRQRELDSGVFLSQPYVGLATKAASFALSRRRSSVTGAFDGTIHVAASPGYFQRFYAEAAPPYAHLAALIRADGFVLARDPPDERVERLAADGTFAQQIAAEPMAGNFRAALTLDGVERDWSYRRVGSYPAYVIFGVERAVLLEQWYANLWVYGAFAGMAAITLLAVSWLALTRSQAEQTALDQLRREIIQRQQAEQQLRHVQRLEAVGQLTGGIAHDFNNLMTAILGNLELIQRTATTALEGGGNAPLTKISRLAGTAVSAVQRGAKLTKSLLAFSRSQPLHMEPVDVNALLTEFSELVRRAMGSRVVLTLALDPALPQAWADSAQLEAAILNLSINARDAMAEHGDEWEGALQFTTGTALLGPDDLKGNPEAKPGRFVRIRVQDNGAGMPPEVAAKAFEPFFTTKPIGQGTGLGLSQVFGFVRQLGGHVTIESQLGEIDPNHGTGVTLFLPMV